MRACPTVLPVFGLLAMATAVAWGDDPADAGAVGDSEKARADAALEVCTQQAREFTILAGEEERELELVPAPVLRWTNPVAGSIHGCVFVWTEEGRPRALASIYQWFDPFDHVGFEFHSLAEERLSGTRAVGPRWTPVAAGIEFATVPDAPAPADRPVARLRQLRAIASRFAASRTDRDGTTNDLRLLPQPLHRYAGADGDRLDGALFCFVLGTDPEVFLLIEAREVDGRPTWQYAAARMNSIQLDLALDGKFVWRGEELPWGRVRDSSAVYFAITDRKPKGP